jgi:hypothetical protein
MLTVTYAECHIFIVIPSAIMLNVIRLIVVMLNVIMLNVFMLNVIMLNVIMLNVIVLSVMAPFKGTQHKVAYSQSFVRKF